jgi:hypothetical protein
MQKLEKRYNNTPTDAPQIRSNCNSVIKHDCVVGQVSQSAKTFSSSSDVDQQSGKTGHNLSVYVVNLQKEPLMPCKPARARHLLEQGKSTVVSRKPFTIQLGIDAGYRYVGISAVSGKKELLSAEVTLRTDISKKLQARAMYRRNRRGRLWHRKPRFDNRSKPKGWLAPSIQHKLDSHIRLVEKIKRLLPITEVTIEVANFDIQKIKNPEIEGKGYQQGEQLGFWNVREYVFHRDNHTCQHCHGKKKDPILQVHHINGKAEGATDRPEELLTVCKTCHDEHHADIDIIPKKKIKNFKLETFMTTVRWKIVNALGCRHTYGYITKHNRIKQGLQKSHVNDAFVIAGGTTQERCKPYIVKQVRRNNRSIQTNRKGFKPSIRRRRYKLQPNDLVRYDEVEYRVKGVHSYGKWIALVDSAKKIINLNIKNVELICYGKGIFE